MQRRMIQLVTVESVMTIRRNQEGLALIALLFIFSLFAVGYLIYALNPTTIQIERNKKTAATLAEAKAVLIGYAIGSVGGGQRPGDLVRPDYFGSTEVPTNYDGSSDSGCMDSTKSNGLPMISSGQNMRCLGRLPWKELSLPIENPSENDPTGEMPWYAVSANLVDSICLTLLNSGILNSGYVGYVCSGATLPHPWLTVRDRLGNVLSSRVAAVIIVPGSPLTGQSRPLPPGLGNAGQYLDSITVTNSVGCTATHVVGTYNNAAMNNEFIMADDTQRVDANDPCYLQPYQFNDKLIYITIDELMAAVEKRAAQEAGQELRNYYVASSATPANRFYPYAATLGDVNSACADNNKSGVIPIVPASANCSSPSACAITFPMTSVSFSLTSGSIFSSATGSCSKATGDCDCTGAGNCKRGAITFTCSATGNCVSSGAGSSGTFEFTYTPTAPDTTSTTGACSGGAGTVACTGAGTFFSTPTNCAHPKPGLSTLPTWFTDNHWQDFITYQLSNDCTFTTPGCVVGSLTVGGKTNVRALLISSSKTLSSQAARPTNNLSDYLDSVENTDGNLVFDSVGKTRSSTYNDQMFIVAP